LTIKGGVLTDIDFSSYKILIMPHLSALFTTPLFLTCYPKAMVVLFVDDDQDDYDLFAEALTTFNPNARCLHTKDGDEALQLLRRLSTLPDYVFLDINMPMMEGRTCLAAIKADPKLQNLTVIMYSTSINTKQALELKELGAKECIVKPSSYTSLVATLKRLVEY
jgi:CheY-like chemotaxis protein